jgi:hypothetical protein
MPHKDPEKRREYQHNRYVNFSTDEREKRRTENRLAMQRKRNQDPVPLREYRQSWRLKNKTRVRFCERQRRARQRLTIIIMLSFILIYHADKHVLESIRISPFFGKRPVKKRKYYQRKIDEVRRKARHRKLPCDFTKSEYHFMMQYWGYACAVCGNQEGFQWTLANDHWIPLASQNSPGTVAVNIIPLCHGIGGCNNEKWNKDPNLWLIAKLGKRRALKKIQEINSYFVIVKKRQEKIN